MNILMILIYGKYMRSLMWVMQLYAKKRSQISIENINSPSITFLEITPPCFTRFGWIWNRDFFFCSIKVMLLQVGEIYFIISKRINLFLLVTRCATVYREHNRTEYRANSRRLPDCVHFSHSDVNEEGSSRSPWYCINTVSSYNLTISDSSKYCTYFAFELQLHFHCNKNGNDL